MILPDRCHASLHRINPQVRGNGHRWRCPPRQALAMERRRSWWPRIRWTRPASARRPQCPVKTPSRLSWSEVSGSCCAHLSGCECSFHLASISCGCNASVPLPASESAPGTFSSALSDIKEAEGRLPQASLQEHVFSECSRERILGLLAAMLPPAKPVQRNKHQFSVWFY